MGYLWRRLIKDAANFDAELLELGDAIIRCDPFDLRRLISLNEEGLNFATDLLVESYGILDETFNLNTIQGRVSILAHSFPEPICSHFDE